MPSFRRARCCNGYGYPAFVVPTGVGVCARNGRQPFGLGPLKLDRRVQTVQQRHLQQPVDDRQLRCVSAGPTAAGQRRATCARADARLRGAQRRYRSSD